MRNPTLLLIILVAAGCTRSTYYVSPLHGNVTPYHTIPLASDSVSSSTYINGQVATGGANDGLSDGVFNFQLNAYRTHQLGGHLQAYYGAGIQTGTYHIKSFKDESRRFSSFLDTARINAAGTKTYSSLGIHGGLNFMVPFGAGHEWRIGMQTAVHKEFGSYLQFRKSLPADSVDGVAKSSTLGSLSLQTELAFQVHNGNFCIKWELGRLLGKDYRDVGFGKTYPFRNRFTYWSFTLQRGLERTGIYTQFTIGNNAFFFQMGVNYRLQGRRKRGQ
jgi:hypothetical protein